MYTEATLGRVYPLIIPALFKERIPDLAGGVGTPRMVYDPETGGWKLFFTGWRNARLREVFVADVDKDFSLENIKKVVSSPPTRDAVNAIYNPWLDGFILLTTEGGPLWIRHLDRRLREKASKKLTEGMQDSGAGILTLMGSYTENNPNAVIFYPRRNRIIWRFINRVDNLTELTLQQELTFSMWEEPNDVIDAFRVNDKFGVLVEYFTDRQNWRSRIAMSGDYLHPKVRALSAPLPVPFTDGYSNFGHPSFTTGPDGRPKVLFSFFMSHAPPFPITDYSKQWRHEIWVWEPSFNIFDPRVYGRMYDILEFDQENTKSPPIYDVFNAKRLILKIRHSVKRNIAVKIQEAVTIKDCLEGNVVEEEHKVTVPCKITINNPLRILRVYSEIGAKIWLIAEF